MTTFSVDVKQYPASTQIPVPWQQSQELHQHLRHIQDHERLAAVIMPGLTG
ncbi:hypothetical protein IC066_004968 [Salmonella enterica]|nr:hypothetical protein [Salmonella enterica]